MTSTPEPRALDVEGLRRLMHIHEGPEASRDTARNYHYALSRAAPALLDAVEERDELTTKTMPCGHLWRFNNEETNDCFECLLERRGGEIVTLRERLETTEKARRIEYEGLEAERAAHARTREALRVLLSHCHGFGPKSPYDAYKLNKAFRAAQALLEGEGDA